MRFPLRTAAAPLATLLGACSLSRPDDRVDMHSFAQPATARVTHVDLDLQLDFAARVVLGQVELRVAGAPAPAPYALRLDTADLTIERVAARNEQGEERPCTFDLAPAQGHLGRAMTVRMPAGATRARITYRTAPGAAALQWLSPAQTHDKVAPFLYTQGQAILTRTWIPLQDSPGVRVTYGARVRAPQELTVLMSARGLGRDRDGAFVFAMDKPVPPYLIALACGKLDFRAIGERCGVWAEPDLLPRAADEFADMERMLLACERLFGPYRWGRYEVLVLPPAFPFGGMENPMLTFATPTILAGDKSLVALIAHELAHSWSGNLVTNATWRDFWLNEGFTVFLENRIMEEVYGPERAAMELLLGLEELTDELRELPPSDQVLHIDLAGRNPDDNMTAVPYEKGAAFLHRLQQVFGRARFDEFLQGYFDRHAFQSITTADFLAYLDANLLRSDPDKAKQVDVARWVHAPGLPPDVVRPDNRAFADLEALRARFVAGEVSAAQLGARAWIPQLWLRFLGGMPEDVDAARLRELDATYGLTETGNCEIFTAWAQLAIARGIDTVDGRVEQFLCEVGRRKYLKPLYEALCRTPAGKARARAIYRKARPGYHAVATRTLDEIVQ